MANETLREYAKKRGVPIWKLADWNKVSEPQFYRRLRYQFPEEEMARQMRGVDELAFAAQEQKEGE